MAGRVIISALGGLKVPRRGTFNIVEPRKPQGALQSKAGVGLPAAQQSVSSSSSGIGGPFTEIAGSRTFHSTVRNLKSSDGLFVLEYYNLRQIKMVDGGGSSVIFNYDDYSP
jgi:hypothetical protein